MKEQWTDERIQKRYDELNAIAPGYPDLNMRDVAREIWSDYEKCVTELEAVVTTLRDMLKTERALLPDEDVIGAILTVCRNLADRDANDEWLLERDAIHVWLERLESEGAE